MSYPLFSRIENNIITTPSRLPLKYEYIVDGVTRTASNFRALESRPADAVKYGFYEYVTPAYDTVTQKLDGLVMLGDNQVTKIIIDKTQEEIDSEFTNSLTSAKSMALDEIDQAAFNVDYKYTTVGGQQASIYDIKPVQIAEWESDPNPDINDIKYGTIWAELERTKVTNPDAIVQDAIDGLKMLISAWQQNLIKYREYYRLVGKAKVENAISIIEVEAAKTEAVTGLSSL
jgi:hypothetical protein